MALTQVLARTALRARLRELTAAAWLDTELNTWLAEGAFDIASRIECLQSTTTATVTASVSAVTAPASVLRIAMMEFAPTAESRVLPLVYKDYKAMRSVWGDQNQGAQYPEFFTTWGFPPNLTIKLFPTPVVGGLANIYYYRTAVTPANDAANLDIVDGWQHYVYDYAEYRAFLRNGDARWQNALAKHEANIEIMRGLTVRAVDEPGEIVDEWPEFGGSGSSWFNRL